jgi:DNA-binding MarR family transcriptional regulator
VLSARDKERLIAYVELLFFAYRDFTAEPDAVLAEFGFGRAHHRVLHFVNRRPGLRVADLLDILKITKQSLARVLKQLIDQGFIVQRAGAADRRERLLYPTAKGSALAEELASLQTARIAKALAEAGADGERSALRFLAGMISPSDQGRVESLVAGAGLSGPARTEDDR